MDKEKATLEVLNWYNEAPSHLQFDFKTCSEADLITYHDNLGRDIRNTFGLWWNHAWIPKLVEGVDVSEEHPDHISMCIIKEVWRRINAL